VPEPFTTYQAIRALPAGSTLLVNRIGARLPKRYHSIAQVYCDAEANVRNRLRANKGDTQSEIRAALLDSVRHHLVADVPVGAFLSSGIDSGALVGLMRDARQHDIQTVTLAFEEFRGKPDDEAPLAAEVARLYGTRHTTRIVTRAEFDADLPRILEAMDQPSIDGINTWLVSKAARELGLKVAVSGLGGDEFFGGYPSFRDVPRWVRLLAIPSRVPGLGRAARHLGQRVGPLLGQNPKAAGMLEFGGSYAGGYLLRRGLFMPWEVGSVLDRDTVRQGLRRLKPLHQASETLVPCPASKYARVAILESAFYMRNQLLRDTDWASMAHSLEVRVPLVDLVFLRRCAPHLLQHEKAWDKNLLALSPSLQLPAATLQKSKTGFSTPIAFWMLPASRTFARPQAPTLLPVRQYAHAIVAAQLAT
jgi:asparagine synthase (glutamine-hydrolysing)